MSDLVAGNQLPASGSGNAVKSIKPDRAISATRLAPHDARSASLQQLARVFGSQGMSALDQSS
jgi:hypothetical protein